MKIIYEVLQELNYIAEEAFTFEYVSNDISKKYSAMPFISSEHPCQAYIIISLQNADLNLADGDFFKLLAKAFRMQPFHQSDMDKNATLFIESKRSDDEVINLAAKVRIEDDPFYFKKYVFSYSDLSENRAIDYLNNKKAERTDSFSYVQEIQTYLLDTTLFSKYKNNHNNELTYGYFAELSTKIPVFPLEITPSNEIKQVEDFLQENIRSKDFDIHKLDRLIDTAIDFKDDKIETILSAWDSIFSN